MRKPSVKVEVYFSDKYKWVVRSLDLSRPSLGEGVSGSESAAWSSKESHGELRVSWVHAGPECLGLTTQAVV